MRRFSVASIPSEVEGKTLKMTTVAYGEILDIHVEISSNAIDTGFTVEYVW
jgi:hypothetical protein